jgi:N-methylhydantoinase B/oxoprolinase/acetone carboxylase alpha subunit
VNVRYKRSAPQKARQIDPITLEVTRARLEAIVEEMGATMLRTAHSSIYVECRDFSVAILHKDGGLLAMGQYIPHHQGGMQAALRSIIRQRGIESMRPGDIYVSNDAYAGGTHTLDISLFMPIFDGDKLICFAGATAHQIDLGGGAPGTYVVGATEVFQEGIVFPQIKAGEHGQFFDDFVRLFQRNVRLPEQQKGDLGAMLAGLKVAIRNVGLIIEEHGADQFQRIVSKILDVSEGLLRDEIRKIPDGSYTYVDYLDGDGIENKLFKMQVTLTIKGTDAFLDFSGTDPQAKGFINASYWNTVASSYSAFFLFFDPTIPRNDGFFRPIHVSVPVGTLLNPRYPAPIGASTTEGGGRVYDLVLGALSKAWPERAFATWSMMWVAVYISGTHPDTGRPYIQAYLDGLANGGGARQDKDGLNACNLSASNMLIPNMEVEEEIYPVRFIRRELAPDSGGPGQYRGGLALETEVEVLADCEFTMFGSRFEGAEPPGYAGGKPGGASVFYTVSNSKKTTYPSKVGRVPLKAGDRVIMRPCGGAGFGDPKTRDPDLIERDLRLGFITPEGAERDYGYRFKAAAE